MEPKAAPPPSPQRSGVASQGGKERKMKRNGEVVVDLAEQIKAGILRGVFKAGDALPEATIVKQFNCSRTSAREALRLLIHSGLTIKTPNQSYRVLQFDERDLYELASLRLVLEQLAARIAFGRQDLTAGMRTALDELREAVRRGDRAEAFAANRHFHEAIINAAEHRRLSQAYTRLSDQIEFAFMTLGHLERDLDRLIGEHERLYEIARTGTLEVFLAELGDHVQGGLGASAILSEARQVPPPRTSANDPGPPHQPAQQKVSDTFECLPTNKSAGLLGW